MGGGVIDFRWEDEKENIDKAKLQYFKKLGNDLLALTKKELDLLGVEIPKVQFLD